VVNASRSVIAGAASRAPIEHEIDDRGSELARALTDALRLYQWVKNVLVFVATITAGAFLDMEAWEAAVTLFIAFSLTASGVYVVNDLEADRQHYRKRNRPFARGDLPLVAGLILGPSLILCGVAVASLFVALEFLLASAALSVSCTMLFRRFPLVAAFVLSGLYSLLLFAGGEVTGNSVSIWLPAFSGFPFYSLALVKRVAELQSSQKNRLENRLGDTTPEIQIFCCRWGYLRALPLMLFSRYM
jgi:4-hydroxybenzoate polyprenyltransferase